jgi:Flp pilus assembly pilin Flp
MQRLRWFLQEQSGSEFVEWAVVLTILAVATFAILQAVGGEVNGVSTAMLHAVRQVLVK